MASQRFEVALRGMALDTTDGRVSMESESLNRFGSFEATNGAVAGRAMGGGMGWMSKDAAAKPDAFFDESGKELDEKRSAGANGIFD